VIRPFDNNSTGVRDHQFEPGHFKRILIVKMGAHNAVALEPPLATSERLSRISASTPRHLGFTPLGAWERPVDYSWRKSFLLTFISKKVNIYYFSTKTLKLSAKKIGIFLHILGPTIYSR
jgi:hypothetical protein